MSDFVSPAVKFASCRVLDRLVAWVGDLTVDKKLIAHHDSANLAGISGASHGASSKEAPIQPPVAMNWRQRAQQLHKQAHVFYFVSRHSRTRWYARLVAVCTAGYLLSPVQLIPSFIPVIGLLDDVAVLFLGVKLLQRITPPDVLAECRDLADAAEKRRKERIGSTAATAASVVIAMVWVLAAVTASALMAAYIRH